MTNITTPTAALFAQLNIYRERNGKSPLKAWKESRAKLIAAMEAEVNANNFEAPVAEIAQQQTRQEVVHNKDLPDVDTSKPANVERSKELKAARLENDRKNKKLEEMEKEQPSPSAKPKSDPKKKPVKSDKSSPGVKFSAAQIIADFGIDPKQGRALLRKHNVDRTPEAVRKFFADRAK